MAYRGDLALSLVAFFLVQLAAPIFAGVIYFAGGEFPGWTIYQVLLLQGILSTIIGVSYMSFFGLLWFTENMVREGKLDIILMRPVNSLWLMIMGGFDEEDGARIVSGLTLIVLALYHIDISGSLTIAILLMFFGILFYLSLAVICSALTLRFIRTRLYEIVNLVQMYASYPGSIYGKKLSIVFSTVVPLLIVAHYPASALLGFAMNGILIAIVSVCVLVTVSIWFWYRTLRKYSSAGG